MNAPQATPSWKNGTYRREWNVTCRGHAIRVTNRWRIRPLESVAKLYVDSALLDECADLRVHPGRPALSAANVSDELRRVEVYFSGIFSVKACILADGMTVHQDRLNLLERIHVRYMAGR